MKRVTFFADFILEAFALTPSLIVVDSGTIIDVSLSFLCFSVGFGISRNPT